MKELIISSGKKLHFIYSEGCETGIVKIARKVANDAERAIGAVTEVSQVSGDASAEDNAVQVAFGVVGQSKMLDDLCKDKTADLSSIAGKREVYGFFIMPDKNMIVIAGSDKLGAIYGLFHMSELMGVSPLTDFSSVVPAKKSELKLTEKDSMISKEPSVRYRGFFINDEWPAFGNWCMKNFGGVNAKMYDHVFELLLRLKGNYLWPAMWSSCFAMEGPGLASAELADEYGIYMGLSHHEPCLRHGEEYSKVRGKDSIYGDAWDFRSNREGITRFWRDGLQRNGHLRNVITVGMRGERDSTILGEEATLKDNIDLLRDVIKTQNELIRENVDADLENVPRMLALYKEVEPYYYGDENTEGLKNDPELDGVILMLCDDNHGYMRSLPDEEMRRHKGGFGMYYHFDYHGGPVSYEWINSTYLPEVWEQMTACYEHGVDQLWIVNVGDLGLQEMPLCYFMDLAYDYEKYGISAPNTTDTYMENWMKMQFGGALEDNDLKLLAKSYTEAVRLIHDRRPEHLNENIYLPQGFGEAYELINNRIPRLKKVFSDMAKKLPEEYKAAYTELIEYNMLGGLNLIEMWINKGYNHYYAGIGAVCANDFAEKIKDALAYDAMLRDKLHSADNGKWYGFGLAEHIGFCNWNCEESKMPVIETVIPVGRAEMAVGLLFENGETRGLDWTKKPLAINRFVKLDSSEKRCAGFFAALCGRSAIDYTVKTDKNWLILDKTGGKVSAEKPLTEHFVTIDDEKLLAEHQRENIVRDKAVIEVKYDGGCVNITVNAVAVREKSENVFTEENGVISVLAEHFTENKAADNTVFKVLKDLGRDESAVKIFPVDADISDVSRAPYVEYSFNTCDEGMFDLNFMIEPTSPFKFGSKIKLAYSLNGGDIITRNVLRDDYEAGVTDEWAQGVLDHVRVIQEKAMLKSGLNTLRFYGISKEVVLEKLVLVREGTKLPKSYFGPQESI